MASILGSLDDIVPVIKQYKFQQLCRLTVVASPSVHRHVLDITDMTQRQVRTVPTVQEYVVTPQRSSWCSRARCYATTGAGYGPYSVLTVEVPQLQFIDSRRHPCCGAEALPGRRFDRGYRGAVNMQRLGLSGCPLTSGMSPRALTHVSARGLRVCRSRWEFSSQVTRHTRLHNQRSEVFDI